MKTQSRALPSSIALTFLGPLSLVLGLSMGTLAHAEHPVDWLERCETTVQSESPLGLDMFGKCQNTIIAFCTHAADPHDCFSQLQDTYAARTKAIVAELPPAIDTDNDEFKRIYSEGMRSLDQGAAPVQCSETLQGMACETDSILSTFRMVELMHRIAYPEEEPK